MDVEVLEFYVRPCNIKFGYALIRYHELVLRCDVVYYSIGHRVWIRMPERWLNPKKKISYGFWPTKETSDEFQKAVLAQIYSDYDLDVDKIANIYISARKKREEIKNQ